MDRPGLRSILSKVVTLAIRRNGANGIQILYVDGLWTRKIGSDFFPDSQTFDYSYADFRAWKCQMERYIADTNEYWFQHYSPREGDTIVDVGAGRGEDTVTFSRAVGATGRVIAIEAHPLSYAILKSFCNLNGLANVTVLHLALMDEPGTVRIIESGTSWLENTIGRDSGSSGTVVRADTLDRVLAEADLREINFLKMNIEGAEQYALRGMESMLPRIRQICVACHDFRNDNGEVGDFRTRAFVEQFLSRRGFSLASRKDDPRAYVRDHVFGLR
jgi:FkbM family methyltransferase